MTATADPTLALLRDLEDPSKYERVDNVPVFKVNRSVKNGKLTDVTAAELARIVEQQRRLEREARVIPRLTFGHTLPDPATPEHRQPEPVGWSRNWRVGTFAGKPAILGTLYYRRDRAAEAKTYPYRSPEYYSGRHEITGVALLRRDPQLDLGVLTYDRGGDCLRYAMEATTVADDTTPDMAPDMDPTGQPDAMAPSPEDSEKFQRCMRHHYPKLYEMGMAPAVGASNGALPGGVEGGPEKQETPKEEEAARMSRETEAIRFARVEAEIKALRAEGAALRYEREQARCEQAVTQLAAEGYLVRDRGKLVAKLAKLPAADRDAELAEIRACYQRDPAHYPEVPVARETPAAAAAGGVTERNLEQVLQYMREHPDVTEWEDAKAAALAVK